jgi:uncharacterized protein with NRDE domain
MVRAQRAWPPRAGDQRPRARPIPSGFALTEIARNGFNLVVAELGAQEFHWATNRPPQHRRVGHGIHAISNAALDTPWPKVVELKRRLEQALHACDDSDALAEAAFDALADRTIAPDQSLPATGVSLERERELSAAFIRVSAPADGKRCIYGTRCSTVVIVERVGVRRVARVTERRFDPSGRASGESTEHLELPA